jgi:hypothetical protein
MRRVIQRTITTTKIISLTITHSEEEVEYTVINGADQLAEPEPAANDPAGLDLAASDETPETTESAAITPEE